MLISILNYLHNDIVHSSMTLFHYYYIVFLKYPIENNRSIVCIPVYRIFLQFVEIMNCLYRILNWHIWWPNVKFHEGKNWAKEIVKSLMLLNIKSLRRKQHDMVLMTLVRVRAYLHVMIRRSFFWCMNFYCSLINCFILKIAAFESM